MDIYQNVKTVLDGIQSWFFAQNWGLWAAIAMGAHLLFHLYKKRKAQKEKKRLQKEAANRRAQFVLPDRDNTFVRARLHTALQEPTDIKVQECDGEKREEFRFAYARKLLTKLKNAPLSATERLQAEDMEKTLGLCLQKERLRPEEIRLMSDTFAAVLKLAAKYAV